jgi:hypothetical protein
LVYVIYLLLKTLIKCNYIVFAWILVLSNN